MAQIVAAERYLKTIEPEPEYIPVWPLAIEWDDVCGNAVVNVDVRSAQPDFREGTVRIQPGEAERVRASDGKWEAFYVRSSHVVWDEEQA